MSGPDASAWTVRPARPGDLPHLPGIERAAGLPFREIGMDVVADDAPPTVEELAAFQQDGRAWVVPDDADVPVGYLIVGVVDGCAHVEQVSVDPRYARRGLGRRLLAVAQQWARAHGHPAMTLTSFAEVPWNAPYYERLGWQVLAEGELTPGLARVREQEAARGLDRWPRVVMRYDLDAAGGGHA